MDSKFLDFQVPRYLKSGLGRAGLGGSAVLGRGGGRRAPQHSTATKPGPTQARFEISGNLEIQTFGIQKMEKIKILKIQICSAQNVGKVWISRKNIILALFGAI